jgi:RNA methyltransferase, TrmH family
LLSKNIASQNLAIIISERSDKIKPAEKNNSTNISAAESKIYRSLQQKKYRRQHGLFIAEGPHLVEAALANNWPVERIIVADDYLSQYAGDNLARKAAVMPRREFDKLALSESPQGVMAIVKERDCRKLAIDQIGKANRIVIADNVADPGNLGTMIRTAAAFGYDLFICLEECAEIYNPKTVRATQGGLFAIAVGEIDTPTRLFELCQNRYGFVTFTGDSKTALAASKPPKRAALVFGSEIHGISPELVERAELNLRIEQTGKVESLNVAVAAGVGMYWGRG